MRKARHCASAAECEDLANTIELRLGKGDETVAHGHDGLCGGSRSGKAASASRLSGMVPIVVFSIGHAKVGGFTRDRAKDIGERRQWDENPDPVPIGSRRTSLNAPLSPW